MTSHARSASRDLSAIIPARAAGGVQAVVDDTGTTWPAPARDTCGRLPAPELRTIFEPFRRGSTMERGTGSGPAIARCAIEARGGSIHAESGDTAGCQVWIVLPER